MEAATSEGAVIARVERVLFDGAMDLEKLLFQIYAEVGQDFARRTARGLKSQWVSETKAAGDAAARLAAAIAAGGPDGWMTVVGAWLDVEAVKRIRAIQGTTFAIVRDTITAGIRQGDGIPAIARRLRQAESAIASRRAVTIARTEVIAASNLGARAGALATGLPLDHEWIATPGQRTRPQHADANGQTRPIEEPFEVGGQRLLFPGDPSRGAAAWNLVNCRCAVGYRPAK